MSQVFRRSTGIGCGCILGPALMLAAWVGAVYVLPKLGADGKGPPISSEVAWMVAAFGLFVLLVDFRSLDHSPKLTLDDTGLIDHRSGRRFQWSEIQSIDARVRGDRGELILYLRSGGGEVTTHTIDISLAGGASNVFTEVKKGWLRFNTPDPLPPAGGAAP